MAEEPEGAAKNMQLLYLLLEDKKHKDNVHLLLFLGWKKQNFLNFGKNYEERKKGKREKGEKGGGGEIFQGNNLE